MRQALISIAVVAAAAWAGPALMESAPSACTALTQRMIVNSSAGHSDDPKQAMVLGFMRMMGPAIEASSPDPWPIPSVRCAVKYWQFVTTGSII